MMKIYMFEIRLHDHKNRTFLCMDFPVSAYIKNFPLGTGIGTIHSSLYLTIRQIPHPTDKLVYKKVGHDVKRKT